MSKKKQIDAKPTTYRNVEYRSRLEARWAILLDNCKNVLNFQYEPITVTSKKGWDYTPDFLVTYFDDNSRQRRIYIEVKPQPPTGEYLHFLTDHIKVLTNPLMLVWGTIYKDEEIASTVLTKGNKGDPVHPVMLFTNFERAHEIASSYRFDI